MEGSTFVSTSSPPGAGGFQVTYGSTLQALSPADKLNTIRMIATKVTPKLRYRGDYGEHEEWKKSILILAHALKIPMRLVEPEEASLRANVKYVDMGETMTDEFKRDLDMVRATFSENSTLHGAIDFSGPMAVADAKHIDSELRNYEYGYSWGHLLWADIEESSGKRVDTSAAKFRQGVANNTKWTDTATNRALLISRISCNFFAWCADPRNEDVNATDFIKPYLLDHFPVSPGEDVLVKMEGHIQSYLRVEVDTLERVLTQRDKDLWLRMFLQEIDIWGKSHGMPDGISGAGDTMLPMEEKKARE